MIEAKRYKPDTIVFHVRRKMFGKMKTGYPKKATSSKDTKKYDICVESHVEPGTFITYSTDWFATNLIIVNEITEQTRLFFKLKYG
jgi:hypothetical protein